MGLSEISVNDLLTAFTLLQPADNVSRAVIAELLGFKADFQGTTEVTLPINAMESSSVEKPDLEQQIQVKGEVASELIYDSAGWRKKEQEFPPVEETTQKDSVAPLRSQSEHSFPSARQISLIPSELSFVSQDVFPTNISISSIPKPQASDADSELLFESLLRKHSSKEIILTMLATTSPEGDIDFDRIIDALSQKKTLNFLPRHNLSTLRRGVQVLVDAGESMIPYRRDEVVLQSEIRRIVGDDNTTVLRFVGTPLRGVRTGLQLRTRNYEPPKPGMPVLVLTDLGIGKPPFSTDPADVNEWIDFINIVKRNKCPLIVFIPYYKKRWPNDLKSIVHIVYWNRSTSSFEIRKQIGKGNFVVE